MKNFEKNEHSKMSGRTGGSDYPFSVDISNNIGREGVDLFFFCKRPIIPP